MGSFSPTIASNPTSQNSGKGGQSSMTPSQSTDQQPIQFQGIGGVSTNAATSGQPQMGNPQDQADMYQPQRRFPNTIQPWDNAQNQPQTKSGKGKG